MRSLLLFFILLSITLPLSSQSIEGNYSNKWEAPSGESLEYSLTLLEGGEFIFNSTRTYRDDLPNSFVQAKGKWKINGQLLILNTHYSEDTENKLQSSLDMNKARFISISPRNPDFNLFRPSLKFYNSEVFYAKDMELIKAESNVSTIFRH